MRGCQTSASTNAAIRSFLGGIAWLFFAIAGLSFFWGGRAINEFTGTDRMLAEMVGFGVAVVSAGFGAVLKAAQERFEAPDDPNRQENALCTAA